MRRRSSFLSGAASVVAVAITGLGFACSDNAFVPYCTGIPAHGCIAAEVDATGTCADPTCAAVYSSNASCQWTFVASCPNYEAPMDAGHTDAADGGTSAADADSGEDVHYRDAGFPLPEGAAGGPGCMDLQSPDCPLQLATACGRGCCGCETLYVCTNGGWNIWGECGADGGLVPENP